MISLDDLQKNVVENKIIETIKNMVESEKWVSGSVYPDLFNWKDENKNVFGFVLLNGLRKTFFANLHADGSMTVRCYGKAETVKKVFSPRKK